MPDETRNYYAETINRLEPDIAAIDLTAGAASISISLRRIANSLAETNALLVSLIDKLEAIEMSVRRR